ncbi:MAG: 16S rRNA (cytidine(1402)-2'-O)-methyltransferase [Marinicaulis sp.]|nr:16S rRNA (cytidine(1402)-2'-O)-methyltransferase [Marinicaulis sp.]
MSNAPITLEPGLYVTATPIGNLGDITYRAVNIMKSADFILCEDTRQTGKLCSAYSIITPLEPYHDHNAAKVRPRIIERLSEGARVCLVSDAGTPLISDPGYKLVRAARDAGIAVIPAPGPSAIMAALSAAGAPTDQFYFAGFPPAKQTARKKFFAQLSDIPATLVFYETGRRLGDSLTDLLGAFGERRCTIARELTKLYEEFVEGGFAELASIYVESPPKGEIVLVVYPPGEKKFSQLEIDEFLATALKNSSVKDAANAAAQSLGIARKHAYQRALELSKAK